MNDDRYYVYCLVDPITKKPFYVGKGRGNRMYSHVYEAKRDKHKWTNTLKCERILSILNKNIDIIYDRVRTELDESSAFILETSLLKKYGRIIDGSGILTNIKLNEEFHIDLPKRKKPKSRRVVQYTLEGKTLSEFPSVSAAADYMRKNKTSILNCCNRKRQTAYGFVWVYTDEDFIKPLDEIPYHTNRRKVVEQYDKNMNFIGEFQSAKDASLYTKIDIQNIRSCLNHTNGQRSAGGYGWKYKSE